MMQAPLSTRNRWQTLRGLGTFEMHTQGSSGNCGRTSMRGDRRSSMCNNVLTRVELCNSCSSTVAVQTH